MTFAYPWTHIEPSWLRWAETSFLERFNHDSRDLIGLKTLNCGMDILRMTESHLMRSRNEEITNTGHMILWSTQTSSRSSGVSLLVDPSKNLWPQHILVGIQKQHNRGHHIYCWLQDVFKEAIAVARCTAIHWAMQKSMAGQKYVYLQTVNGDQEKTHPPLQTTINW